MSTEHASNNFSQDLQIGACTYLLHMLLQRLELQKHGLIQEMTEGVSADQAAMSSAKSAAAAHGVQVADEALRMLRFISAQLALDSKA